jgi:hypothetical protein
MPMAEAPRAWLDEEKASPSTRSLAVIQAAFERAARGHGDPILRCASCGHAITSKASAFEVEGAHEHVRTNPAGFTFRIGCFREAPGCSGEGAASEHFSWFPGYAWQIALCRGCGGHLGWVFRLDSSGFYGLIKARLVQGR